MYKIIGILKRPEGMPFEEFKKWWLQEHAPKVKKWKGLSEYRINFSSTPDQRFDGVAEVWFKNKNDMDVVFAHAHRLIVLNRGELIAGGLVEDVRNDQRVQEVYLGGGNTFEIGKHIHA